MVRHHFFIDLAKYSSLMVGESRSVPSTKWPKAETPWHTSCSNFFYREAKSFLLCCLTWLCIFPAVLHVRLHWECLRFLSLCLWTTEERESSNPRPSVLSAPNFFKAKFLGKKDNLSEMNGKMMASMIPSASCNYRHVQTLSHSKPFTHSRELVCTSKPLHTMVFQAELLVVTAWAVKQLRSVGFPEVK